MKSTLDQIEDIKNHGYTIDFSAVFNHAIENFKKISLYSALIIVVFSFVFGLAILGIIAGVYGAESLTREFFENLETQKLSYSEILISTIGVSFITALLAPFSAGFLKMADSADKDEEFNVSTIFTYYKAPYFGQLFLATLVIALIGTAISNVIESAGLRFVGGMLSGIISFFTFLTIPLIIFGKLKALEAIKSSIIVISKNPLLMFALFIIGFLGSMVGFVACCVGVVFTLVFNTSMTYATYYAIFNEEEQEDSIDSIGQSDFE
ncbi:hypothetical protein [Flavobacterium sp. KJJ]|uniref:hypothetical protein n=1 Tax=Flavobacterium sp. KJJ TaxID=1270193 RepID=UPI0004937A4C|nr:hypothetical protein [Flavobacterium sp. KJJ]